MLNVKFNNGLSVSFDQGALADVMRLYFSHTTTFLQGEGIDFEIALTPTKVVPETEEKKVSKVEEEPKPRRRGRRKKVTTEETPEPVKEVEDESTTETEEPTVEEEDQTDTPEPEAETPVERDLLQEAIDEHPLGDEEPVGEIADEAPVVQDDMIDLGRPLFE